MISFAVTERKETTDEHQWTQIRRRRTAVSGKLRCRRTVTAINLRARARFTSGIRVYAAYRVRGSRVLKKTSVGPAQAPRRNDTLASAPNRSVFPLRCARALPRLCSRRRFRRFEKFSYP